MRCIACNSILTNKDLSSDRLQELCFKCLSDSGVMFFSSDSLPQEIDEDKDD